MMVFQLLKDAVREGDVMRVEQLLTQDSDTENVTRSELRSVLLEAIALKYSEILDYLLDGRRLEQIKDNLIDASNQSLLGFAVLRHFDEKTLKVLASKGCDVLSQDECFQLVHDLELCYRLPDLTEFEQKLAQLKTFLQICKQKSVHKMFRQLLSDDKQYQYIFASVEWVSHHFKYNYGLNDFHVTNKFHMEIATEKWADAKETIKVLDSLTVNMWVFDKYPPDENTQRWTLISLAISSDRYDLIQLLIEKGADVNAHSERLYNGTMVKFTPFELAVERSMLPVCELLIKSSANLYLQISNPIGNILENSVRQGNLDIVKLILDNRIYSAFDIKECIDNTCEKIQNNITNAQMVKMLQVYQAFGTTDTNKAVDVLMLLANNQDTEALEVIQTLQAQDLNFAIEPKNQIKPCWSLLMYATKHNKFNVVESLLDKGCLPDDHLQSDDWSVYPYAFKCALVYAIEENNLAVCKLFLDKGATCHTRFLTQVPDCSVFHMAIKNKNLKMLELLVTHFGDAGILFWEFFYFCENMDVPEIDEILELFPLDFLCCVLRQKRVSRKMWSEILLGCSLIDGQPTVRAANVRRVMHVIMSMLINFFPFAPVELQAAICSFTDEEKVISRLQKNEMTLKERNWLQERVIRCPSLQSMCRHSLRMSIQPFTRSVVQAMGIPAHLNDYLLEHPLQRAPHTEQLTQEQLGQPTECFYLFLKE